MRVLVTGGTGFIGSYVLRALAGTEHAARILVRDPSSASLAATSERFSVVEGDILNVASLDRAMDGCDAVIHLVGIIREHIGRGVTFENIHARGTHNVVEAALRSRVKTFVHMSANGARKDGVSRYQTTKWEAEEAVRTAGLGGWTIFRPSLVFGRPDPGRPEFASDLVNQLVRPFPVLPVFGDGKYQLQPVAVVSLAEAMVNALDGDFHGSVFEVAGPEAISYNDILDRLALAVGLSPKPKIHTPISLVSTGIAALGWTGLLPITADQLRMLVEGNTCDFEEFHRAFRLEPVPFDTERLSYLAAV